MRRRAMSSITDSDLPGEEADLQQGQSQARDRMIEAIVGPEDDHIYISPEDDINTFHGRFAGLNVLRTVRDLCDEVVGNPGQGFGRSLALSFDSTYLDTSTYNQMASLALLPSREVLQSTISVAMDAAMSCQECFDRVALQAQIETLYTKDPEQYTPDDRRALALVYALMALGRQVDSTALPTSEETGLLVLRG